MYRKKSFQQKVLPIKPTFTNNHFRYDNLKEKIQKKFITEVHNTKDDLPSQRLRKSVRQHFVEESDNNPKSERQSETKKERKLSFFHCDSLAIRPNFVQIQPQPSEKQDEESKQSMQESTEEEKEGIKTSINEKVLQLHNFHKQNFQKKRKTIFRSIRPSLGLKELEVNRLNKGLKREEECHITFEADQIVQCCF